MAINGGNTFYPFPSEIATGLQAAAVAFQRAAAHHGHDLADLVARDAPGEVVEELQADELILAPKWNIYWYCRGSYME